MITCNDLTISLNAMINSLLVKDADGNVGIRTRIITVDADTIDDYRECDGVNLENGRALQFAIGLSPVDNKPVLNLIVGT